MKSNVTKQFEIEDGDCIFSTFSVAPEMWTDCVSATGISFNTVPGTHDKKTLSLGRLALRKLLDIIYVEAQVFPLGLHRRHHRRNGHTAWRRGCRRRQRHCRRQRRCRRHGRRRCRCRRHARLRRWNRRSLAATD